MNGFDSSCKVFSPSSLLLESPAYYLSARLWVSIVFRPLSYYTQSAHAPVVEKITSTLLYWQLFWIEFWWCQYIALKHCIPAGISSWYFLAFVNVRVHQLYATECANMIGWFTRQRHWTVIRVLLSIACTQCGREFMVLVWSTKRSRCTSVSAVVHS